MLVYMLGKHSGSAKASCEFGNIFSRCKGVIRGIDGVGKQLR